MLERLLSRAEITSDMTDFVVASHHVLVYHQSFQAHWTPSMNSPCANSDLSAKAISKPICKTSAGIDEGTCRVNTADKSGRCSFVFCHD